MVTNEVTGWEKMAAATAQAATIVAAIMAAAGVTAVIAAAAAIIAAIPEVVATVLRVTLAPAPARIRAPQATRQARQA
jgi:hypothetical protein